MESIKQNVELAIKIAQDKGITLTGDNYTQLVTILFMEKRLDSSSGSTDFLLNMLKSMRKDKD